MTRVNTRRALRTRLRALQCELAVQHAENVRLHNALAECRRQMVRALDDMRKLREQIISLQVDIPAYTEDTPAN